MKHKLTLSEALTLQEKIVRGIEETENSIINYNSTDKNTSNLFVHLTDLENQLVVIKEAIQTANKKKGKDGKTNNFWIYTLSNLNRRRAFFNLLNPKKDDKKAQVTKKKVEEMRKSVGEDINKIYNKLEIFNTDTKIKVEINESLNLL